MSAHERSARRCGGGARHAVPSSPAGGAPSCLATSSSPTRPSRARSWSRAWCSLPRRMRTRRSRCCCPRFCLRTSAGGLFDAVTRGRAEQAQRLLSEAGIEVVRTAIGDAAPLLAIEDELAERAGAYDTIVLCTLPVGVSRWLRMRVDRDAAERFGLPLIHVEARLASRLEFRRRRSRPRAHPGALGRVAAGDGRRAGVGHADREPRRDRARGRGGRRAGRCDRRDVRRLASLHLSRRRRARSSPPWHRQGAVRRGALAPLTRGHSHRLRHGQRGERRPGWRSSTRSATASKATSCCPTSSTAEPRPERGYWRASV